MRSRLAMGAALAGVVIGAGCSPNPTGVLGNGEFRYLCGDSADTACSSAGDNTDLPGAIAVGSTFQILYKPNSSTGSVQGDTGYEIVAASPRLASTSGDTIAALNPGYEALLARHVGNTTIDDFVHLRFESIRRLVVSPSTPVTVQVGGQESIGLQPLDALDAPLAGRLSCQWTVTAGGAAIVVTGSPTGGSATITASGAGATAGNVHATCGDASVDVPVTVTGVTQGDAGNPIVDGGGPLDASGPVDGADSSDGGPLG
jgi:hypothetical protein